MPDPQLSFKFFQRCVFQEIKNKMYNALHMQQTGSEEGLLDPVAKAISKSDRHILKHIYEHTKRKNESQNDCTLC